MPKTVAIFLKIPNAQKMTGHFLQRTSATILANAGADILTLETRKLKSNSVAEGYIADSRKTKLEIASTVGDEVIINNPKRNSIPPNKSKELRGHVGHKFSTLSEIQVFQVQHHQH